MPVSLGSQYHQLRVGHEEHTHNQYRFPVSVPCIGMTSACAHTLRIYSLSSKVAQMWLRLGGLQVSHVTYPIQDNL